jgi:hypothetical protein
MSLSYDVFDRSDIHVIDDYSGPEKIHRIENIKMKLKVHDEYGFISFLALQDNKIINICNKHMYYFPEVVKSLSGHKYLLELHDLYINLKEEPIIETIDKCVFQFFDYESVTGTGHSFDLMMYLLYIYKANGLTCKLLIPNSSNIHFRKTCMLLKEYCGVEFLEIENNKVYHFTSYICARTYLNILFNDVKKFVNNTLITPIIKKYDALNIPTFDSVARIKSGLAYTTNLSDTSFHLTEQFLSYCEKNRIYIIDTDLPEDLKIYYINKASNITVCWGSIFYIYIDYYLMSTENKYIKVLYHKNIMSERKFLLSLGNSTYMQTMLKYSPVSNQVYNTLTFKGDIVEDLTSLDNISLNN